MSGTNERPKRGAEAPEAALRVWLRQRRTWIALQELRREGLAQAARRARQQRRILSTPPIRTATFGPVEVRVLTWRRDWVNAIWSLKSFYHFAQVGYPLYIHDGGLLPGQAESLRHHFPDATLVRAGEADERVRQLLSARRAARSLAYRLRNPSTRKLFDFFLLSHAEHVISVDADVLFFRRPSELLVGAAPSPSTSRYNKDFQYAYSLPLDELEASFGLRPPPYVNSGLSVVRRESIDFELIEHCLTNPAMFEDRWVTEQTLHALCAARFGVEFLPDTYRVSTSAGLTPEMICKHYTGYFRPLLYKEGMRHLEDIGLLRALHKGDRARQSGPAPTRVRLG